MLKLSFLGVLVATIAIGYFFRGAFGREASVWLVVGLIGAVVVLKLVQLGLGRYLKIHETRMSPEERQKFEEFKKRNSDNEDAT